MRSAGRKPLPLKKGDTIGIVAPAGPVDARRLEKGRARLVRAGYRVEIAKGVLQTRGFLAGDDAHRAAQLRWGLFAPAVRAVMAARGGYGTTRLLPLIDWKKAARHPRLVVGYSDLSALLSWLATRLGIPAIHGPMAAADVARRPEGEMLDAFARLAAGEVSPREPWGPPSERVRGGACEGILAGGCLSVLTALLGTPFEPDFRGALLFLEDVSEPSYRVDRMLVHWLQSGRWKRIAGLLVGKIEPVRGETEDDLRGLFAQAGKALSVPVWYGFPAGHAGPNRPLPFGVPARIDARGRLFLRGSPVAR